MPHLIQMATHEGEKCIAASEGEKWKLSLTKNYKNILGPRFPRLPKDLNFFSLAVQNIVHLPVLSRQQNAQRRRSSCCSTQDDFCPEDLNKCPQSQRRAGMQWLQYICDTLASLHSAVILHFISLTHIPYTVLGRCFTRAQWSHKAKFMYFPTLRAATAMA